MHVRVNLASPVLSFIFFIKDMSVQLFKVMYLQIELGIKLQTFKLVSGDAHPVKGHDKVTIDHLSDFHDLVESCWLAL